MSKVPKWMQDAVAMNPNYTGWSPGEDLLGSNNPQAWDCNGFYDDFEKFWKAWGYALDDVNECVHFYFYPYTKKAGRYGMELNLWVINPRKGASKGVTVRSLNEDDVPRAVEWLRQAARRNAERFAKLEPK